MKTKNEKLLEWTTFVVLDTLDNEDKALPFSIVAAMGTVKYESSISTLGRKIDFLVEIGLIDEERVYRKRYLKINEKGKKVLEHFRGILNVTEVP